MISPPGTLRAAGKSRRGKCGRRPLRVEGETQPRVVQNSHRRPQNTGLRVGSDGGVRAGDLQSAAPAGGAPAQPREVRTPSPATATPSGSSTWEEDGTPSGRAPAPIQGAQPAVPTLKTLFLSELSDLRPRQLRLGEAWVQQRPPSDHRRWASQPLGLRDLGCRRPPPLPNRTPPSLSLALRT